MSSSNDTIITPELFHKSYKDFIIKWIEIKNNTWSNFFVEPEDFYSLIIEKLFIDNKVSQFNSKHHSKAKFSTWLNIFLKNLHTDLYRKKTHQSLDQLIEDNSREIISLEQDSYNQPDNFTIDNSKQIIKIIISKIESLQNLKERVLIKLKLFIVNVIQFNNDEIEYMSQNSDINNNEVLLFINDNVKSDGFGLKDKDIALLTEFAFGSVNTSYQRIVRKLDLNSYNIFKD